MKILIVEDEQDLRETIRTSLLKEKFVVETAADYFSALDKINDYDYDCILLDIMLPGGSGLDLLRELKRLHRSDSVLIISAKDSLDDKVDWAIHWCRKAVRCGRKIMYLTIFWNRKRKYHGPLG